ncbi:hypothetical protein H109_02247, partial [Trichophyton interdigitale MR816]
SMYRPVIRVERDAGLLYGMRYWLDLSPAMQSIHGLWNMPCVVYLDFLDSRQRPTPSTSTKEKPPYPRHIQTPLG